MEKMPYLNLFLSLSTLLQFILCFLFNMLLNVHTSRSLNLSLHFLFVFACFNSSFQVSLPLLSGNLIIEINGIINVLL